MHSMLLGDLGAATVPTIEIHEVGTSAKDKLSATQDIYHSQWRACAGAKRWSRAEVCGLCYRLGYGPRNPKNRLVACCGTQNSPRPDDMQQRFRLRRWLALKGWMLRAATMMLCFQGL